MIKLNKELGQASRLLLVLAIVVLVAVVIVYLVMKMADRAPDPKPPSDIKLPVYEQTLGNIRLVFQSAIDRGDILRATKTGQKDFVATAGGKFIQVTVAAQNMGTENTDQNDWDINNIVDSEGRNFIPVEGGNIRTWLPEKNFCGVALKPAFDPIPCTKIYEVSKVAKELKIVVEAGKNRTSTLDIIVK